MMMDDEQRLIWFIEHWYEKRVGQHIEGMFQHLSFFLIASSFLLTAYAVVGSQWRDCDAKGAILGIVAGTGLALSLVFYASNSWNCRIVWEYSRWVQGKNTREKRKSASPMWLWGSGTVPSLGVGSRELLNGFEAECTFHWRPFVGALLDTGLTAKAGLITRMVPAGFAVTWTSIILVMLRVAQTWWTVVFGTVFLVFLVRHLFVRPKSTSKIGADQK